MKFALMIPTPEVTVDNTYVKMPLGSFEQTCQIAHQMGFDGIEIMSATPRNAFNHALAKAIDLYELGVAGFNSGRLLFDEGLSLIAEEKMIQKQAITALKIMIQTASRFHTHINIGMFRGKPIGDDPEKQLINILREVGEYASDHGVKLLLEPSNRKELPFISTTAEGIRMIQQVDHANVALMLDTFHMMVENEDIHRSCEQAAPYLHHIHFLDRNRNPPTLECQDFDVPGMMQVLKQIGYVDYISMPLAKTDQNIRKNLQDLQSI